MNALDPTTPTPAGTWVRALVGGLAGAIIIAVGALFQGAGLLEVGLAEALLGLTAAALIMHRLSQSKADPRGADTTAAILLLLAAAALAAGAPLLPPVRLVLAHLALAAFVLSLVALGWGRRGLAALAVPVLVLYLVVPVLPLFESTLSYPMRRFSALVTAALLDPVFGPVTLQGTEVWVGAVKFSVTSACSGLELLQNLAWVAWWTVLTRQRGFWRRLSHAAIAVPAALVANTVRVLALALWALHSGEEVLLSPGHGYIAWGAVALAAGLFVWVEGRLPATADDDEAAGDEQGPGPDPNDKPPTGT